MSFNSIEYKTIFLYLRENQNDGMIKGGGKKNRYETLVLAVVMAP